MCCCWSLLCSTILRSRADSLCSHVTLHEWLAFYSAFFWTPPKWCTYSSGMAGATWNCCHLGAFCVHRTPMHHVTSYAAQRVASGQWAPPTDVTSHRSEAAPTCWTDNLHVTSTSLICHITYNRFGKNGEQLSVLLVRQYTSQLAYLCHKCVQWPRGHSWEKFDNPHCDPFYEEDCCVIFALENPGKFCHWLRKSIALEQTAAVVSLHHFRNMSPLFSAKHSVKTRNLFIDDRNEISESSEVENEERLDLLRALIS